MPTRPLRNHRNPISNISQTKILHFTKYSQSQVIFKFKTINTGVFFSIQYNPEVRHEQEIRRRVEENLRQMALSTHHGGENNDSTGEEEKRRRKKKHGKQEEEEEKEEEGRKHRKQEVEQEGREDGRKHRKRRS
jgi:hypothetical protein